MLNASDLPANKNVEDVLTEALADNDFDGSTTDNSEHGAVESRVTLPISFSANVIQQVRDFFFDEQIICLSLLRPKSLILLCYLNYTFPLIQYTERR